MARLFVTSINLNKNELQNARIQNLSSEPSSPVLGQIYYNSSDNKMYYYNGLASPNGPWVTMSGSDEVIQDVLADAIVAGTGLTKSYDDPAGTLTLAIDNTVVTKTDVQNLTNKTIDDKLYFGYDNSFPSYIEGQIDSNGDLKVHGGNNLNLETQNGNINLSPDGYVQINSSLDVAGNIYTNSNVNVNQQVNVGGINGSDGKVTVSNLDSSNKIVLDSSNSWGNKPSLQLWDDTVLRFIDNYNEILTGNIWIDSANPGRLNVNATGEIILSTDGNNNSSGDIILNPDSQVRVNSNLHVSNNAYIANGIYAGGNDTQTNGYVRIQDANGNNLVTADAANNEATVEVKGTINVYKPGGNAVVGIYSDADSNGVIDGRNNNLILKSDSGNAYMNTVTSDNRIITVSDLAAVSSGLDWKQAVNLLWDDVNASTTGASATLLIDGHATLSGANNGYRILITSGSNAGIWTFNDDGDVWTLTRPTDADTDPELKGAAVFVMEGDKYGSTSWVQNNHYITNFQGQEWTQFSGQGTYVGTNSIDITGREVSVILDSDSLEITQDGLKVKYHTDGGLDNDSGMYVKLGTGLVFDGSGNITNDINNGYGVRKFVDTIGNNSATSFTINHAFGTRHVTVQIFQAGTPYAQVEADVERTDANNVTVKFAHAPGNGEYEVVVIG